MKPELVNTNYYPIVALCPHLKPYLCF